MWFQTDTLATNKQYSDPTVEDLKSSPLTQTMSIATGACYKLPHTISLAHEPLLNIVLEL